MSEFYTILVVDDDASVLMAMQHALKMEGYDVHTAGDGIQALEIARETPPDLIPCDYVMP